MSASSKRLLYALLISTMLLAVSILAVLMNLVAPLEQTSYL